MADTILKLNVSSQEYDSKQQAVEKLGRIIDEEWQKK